MPSSSATASACSPAAPPNAIIANSRGSSPFSNRDSRMAAPSVAFVTARSPSAAASSSRPSGVPTWPRHRRSRCCQIEPHAATEECIRIETAQHDVGVGDGRLRSAPAVAGRARPGAGAFRTNGQAAPFAHLGERAAAGSDGSDLDHRQADRHPVDFALGDHVGAAIANDRHVEAGAAPYRRQRHWLRRGPQQEERRQRCRRRVPTTAAAPVVVSPSRCCRRHRSTARAAAAARIVPRASSSRADRGSERSPASAAR